ncbi:MAG: ABC transporter permease [Lachnospiraceae bacterium]|nr:ABC transporter permease [Lachnospiraceae bacterium]
MCDKKKVFALGPREKALISVVGFTLIVAVVMLIGSRIPDSAIMTDFANINQAPSSSHIFGTDWMGRDMLLRTLKGLSLSIWVGIICSLSSTCVAVIMGIIGPVFGKKVDAVICFLVDLVLSIPHTIVVILVSIACGGGFRGLVVGVAITHWTSLTRVIRAEILQLKEAEYIKTAEMFGKTRAQICVQHMLPHIVPQLIVGTILVFPHAIIHEASITFLGFGLPSHEPAIGIILSESMKYLTSGQWWLATFPGLTLVLISLAVSSVGRNLEKIIDPAAAYKI